MIHTIPYFDAHCDTIHRCHTAGTPFRDPELRAFYDAAGDLRRSGGHIDLERAGGFSRYAQFFALYQSPRLVPEGSSMPEQGILLHQRFLREMEENRERILPCRTGAEVDEAVRQGKAAALLSIEGAELLDCDIRRLDTAYDWGVRLLNPVWNYANRLSGSNAQQPEQGLTAYGRDFLRGCVPSVGCGLLGRGASGPAACGGLPLQQPGRLPPPAQPHRRYVPGHPGQRRRGRS